MNHAPRILGLAAFATLIGVVILATIWRMGNSRSQGVHPTRDAAPSSLGARTPDPALPSPASATGTTAVSRVEISRRATDSPAAVEARRQLTILNEILTAKNDNDLRLDTELRDLSPETRAAMTSKYRELSPEKLNERGTIVFLMGRNIQTSEDVAFLREVLEERACLSLSNCSELPAPAAPDSHADHSAEGNPLTLAYPQLTALNSLAQARENSELTPELRSAIDAALESAKRSPVRAVSVRAKGLSTGR